MIENRKLTHFIYSIETIGRTFTPITLPIGLTDGLPDQLGLVGIGRYRSISR